MPDRRTFLITCTGIVAAPAFAHLGVLAAAADSPRAMVEAPGAPCAMVETHGPTLRIDGWDSAADSGDDVWLQINSSWRATWR
jgi:hypothetical protein